MGINSNRVDHYSGSGHANRGPTSTAPVTITVSGETMTSLELHNVCLPPQKSTLQKLRHRLSEIFFPDDPLHGFKNQSRLKKLVLALQFFFPIFEWAPNYSFTLLRSDVVSGLTIASLAIPQGISYAKLANLPPIIGLYSSFVPPLIYSVLGSSKHLAVGPVSIASLVMGTMLNEAVPYTQNPGLYLKLAFTATFFAGVFQATLGLLRLGFVIDFLSKATLVGFMAGAAVIVSLQQLKGLLGIVHFTTKMQIIPVLSSAIRQENEWSWQTIVMGFCFLAFLLTTRHIGMRKPKLFWVSAAAPLASVILSTLLVTLFRSKLHGVATIGHLDKGLNPPSSNMLYFHGEFLGLAIKTGIITGILSLTEGIAVGRTFAALNDYQVDGNKEMIAIGLMNMAGSCSSCYVTTGSFSRSAVNANAGAKTVVSNIIMASTVLITLLFLMPLFHYTPNLILAAIIITAVIGLIDYQSTVRLWKVDKLDFVACLSSFFGVLFISVPIGLAIAVGVSVFKILLHVTRPNTSVLGNIPGTQIYQNVNRYREARRVPSFVILGIEAPIYFANSTYLQERILRWIREEEEWLAANNGSSLRCVIIDMTSVTGIDTSGLAMVKELKKMLEKRSLQLVLANPGGSVMEKLHQSNILETFGLEGIYLMVDEAVADISSSWKAQP
ncbi:probable sulfate transporter 3.4 [Cynara cardunculus var. scolymus]|uniref:probable sulfate transporter 3.4 n=1 Tax=Cynara cardunculus var. scolymus TaxID=59895 RepID=UPI000D62A895|nr:probable sulfate transporter 3.4 [Cynara cardunculus var. scolymus]